jgi:hypothetical protein
LFAFASRTPSSAGDDDDEGATTQRNTHCNFPPSLLFRCNRCGAMDWSNRDCMQERRGDLSKQIQSKTGNGIISERDWKLVVLYRQYWRAENISISSAFILSSHCIRFHTCPPHNILSLSLPTHTFFPPQLVCIVFGFVLFFFVFENFVRAVWKRGYENV